MDVFISCFASVGQGIRLRNEDPALTKAAKTFSTDPKVIELALALLNPEKDGYTFVDAYRQTRPLDESWQVALKVLHEWCQLKPRHAFSNNLVAAFRSIGMNAAADDLEEEFKRRQPTSEFASLFSHETLITV